MKGTFTQLSLGNGRFALLDEDNAYLAQRSWRAEEHENGKFYAVRTEGTGTEKRSVRMHSLVINVEDGLLVDHINGNGLDNRRENLRVCNDKRNSQNRTKAKNSNTTSQYKGVSWDKRKQKWRATIRSGNNKTGRSPQIFLGYFTEELAAAAAYDVAARDLFGEFACLNLSTKKMCNPLFDATDGACACWWRGCDHGVKQTCERLQRVATGDFTGKPSFASEEMNALAGDILGLRGTVATLSNILGELRRSTVINQTKPEFLSDEVWDDLNGIYLRLKSG